MKKMKVNLRIKIIYTCIIAVFVSVFLIMQYSFNRSRNLLITQEAGIISQYMNRNELALTEVTDSIRKLSAASSTNKQVASYLNQSCDGNIYSSENVSRIRAVEETLDMEGPVICEVFVSMDQNFEPKSSAKRLPDGTMVSPPLEDLSPFLPEEEMDGNMIIPRVRE